MKFEDRQYDLYTILGDPGAPNLWSWPQWDEVSKSLDPVIELCRDKALVRCSQYLEDRKTEVKFGRIGWNLKGHQKWVHGAPVSTEDKSKWKFFFTEISAPSLPQAWRDRIPPDFFMVLFNEAYLSPKTALLFNPRVLIAVAADMPTAVLDQIRSSSFQIAELIKSQLHLYQRRPWGTASGSGFTNAIQDISFTGLFKVGNPHTRPLDLNTFTEPWERLSTI